MDGDTRKDIGAVTLNINRAVHNWNLLWKCCFEQKLLSSSHCYMSEIMEELLGRTELFQIL